jgi:hypothetical protein
MTACLITYANLYRNIEYFKNSPPRLIVFDEYHILTDNFSKENHGYRTAVMSLPHCARLGLTATPFINNEMEAVVAVGLLNNASLISKFYSSDADKKRSLVQKVKELKDVFLFYRKNQDNSDASEWVISIPMDKELYCQYEEVSSKTENEPMRRQHQIGKLTVSPSLIDKNLKLDLDSKIITGKIIALRSIVEHLPPGDKIVIVDTYRETLQYIARLDFIRPLKPVLYLGGQKAANKKNLDIFLSESDRGVFLTTRQEGGEGLNLQAANHLVLMNCWFTAKDLIQIFGRIKRKGQVKPVYAYLLGYNLADCLGPGKCPEQYFLPEELNLYKAIREKTEMCEEWGIEVSTKLPKSRVFVKSSTFEQEFNNFLNYVLLPKQPMIESDEMKREREEGERETERQEAIRQSNIDKEINVGKTLLDLLYFSIMQNLLSHTDSPNHEPTRRKVIVVKKKPKNQDG